MEPPILIPALEPDDVLVGIVRDLRARSRSGIIVVDDGSGSLARPVFRAVAGIPGCAVLSHSRNFGKGRALRTAMTHVLAACPGAPGVVTADADGQHAVDDVLRVMDCLVARPTALILGVRRFSREVPSRNLLGNVLVRRALRLITGVELSDTQTGLRGIPAAWLPVLIELDAERYAFEMQVLLWACAHSVEIVELPIRTIYAGRVSHFAPVRDSVRIGVTLARFAVSAAFTRLGRRRPAPAQSRTRQTITPSAGR